MYNSYGNFDISPSRKSSNYQNVNFKGGQPIDTRIKGNGFNAIGVATMFYWYNIANGRLYTPSDDNAKIFLDDLISYGRFNSAKIKPVEGYDGLYVAKIKAYDT